MNEAKSGIAEAQVQLTALTADLSRPIVLEWDGHPVAVLISVAQYEHYQALLTREGQLFASEARRMADQVVFGELVGCTISSGEPIWSPAPRPHWRVPYRYFDGSLLKIVEVDAQTGRVMLTEEERADLLEQVGRLTVAAEDR